MQPCQEHLLMGAGIHARVEGAQCAATLLNPLFSMNCPNAHKDLKKNLLLRTCWYQCLQMQQLMKATGGTSADTHSHGSNSWRLSEIPIPSTPHQGRKKKPTAGAVAMRSPACAPKLRVNPSLSRTLLLSAFEREEKQTAR